MPGYRERLRRQETIEFLRDVEQSMLAAIDRAERNISRSISRFEKSLQRWDGL